MKKFTSLVVLLTSLTFFSFSCYSSQIGRPVANNAVVFWGNFKRGDFIHYYSTAQVVELYNVRKPIEKDSLYYFEESVGDFVEMRFNNEMVSGVNYLCFPNDTIEILVKGRNAYRLKSKDPVRQHELDWQYELDSAGMLSIRGMDGDLGKIQESYNQLMEELKQKRNEGKFSDRFYETMKRVLLCTYVNQSLYPILRELKPNGEVDVIALYKIFPRDEKYLQLYTYNQALLNLTKACVLQDGLPLTKINILDFAKRNFEGRIRDYIPTAFIRWEIENNSFDYADEKLFTESIMDPFYKNVILDCYDKKIDQESRLISTSDQQLKLANILNVGKDTLLYVDFWASWCVPCKEEMKYYPKLLYKFKNQKVKFLFISLDTDVGFWEDDVKNYVFMDESNSFILSDPKNSKLVEDLNILFIPRYLIFKDGKIYMRNALRPSEIQDFEDFLPRKNL